MFLTTFESAYHLIDLLGNKIIFATYKIATNKNAEVMSRATKDKRQLLNSGVLVRPQCVPLT